MRADERGFMVRYFIVWFLDPAEARAAAQAAAKPVRCVKPPGHKRKHAGHVAHIPFAAGVAVKGCGANLRQPVGPLPAFAAVGLPLHRKLAKTRIRIAQVLGFGQMR